MKHFLTIILLCLCTICGAQAQNRKDYHFETTLGQPTDDGCFGSVIVKGYIGSSDIPSF